MHEDALCAKLPIGLEKAATGIEGVDEITNGGLPRERTTLIVGGPGCGKTVFALQTLVNGARRGEPGIFVAFEENSRQIVANAASFGWDLPALERDKLFFLDARMSPDTVQAGDFDLAGLLASLGAKVDEMGARRIVFDSLDVMVGLLGNTSAEWREIYRLRDWLSASALTGIITARLPRGAGGASLRDDFFEFVADCVIELGMRVQDAVGLRYLQVIKYRGSSFNKNEAPLVISQTGIQVADPGPTELAYPIYTERVSTGVQRLDTMLYGGYMRGTSTLFTGAPGTAKSTLCGAFVEAACRRGEGVLYVALDESGDEIARNLTSVGMRLAPHMAAGLLTMSSARTEALGIEEHLLQVRTLIRKHRPHCMVIDPLSAMLHVGGRLDGTDAARRLLFLAKSEGITLVCSSLVSGDPMLEAAEVRISTLADTWIHLAYVVQAGERNRTLTIVKSRGVGHSNQVRELILGDQGVTLADVYSAGGEVLVGTLRWEREQAEENERRRQERELERQRRELELAQAEASSRMEALQREMEARRMDLARLDGEQAESERRRMASGGDLLRRRDADEEASV